MNSTSHSFKLSTNTIQLLLLASILEGCFSIAAALLLPSEPPRVVWLGLSINRLILLLFSVVLITLFSWFFFQPKILAAGLDKVEWSEETINLLNLIGIIFFFFLWITAFTPANILGAQEYFFVRLKPFLFWIEFSVFQLFLILRISLRPVIFNFSTFDWKNNLPAWIFILFTAIWGFISTTKIGLVQKIPYWNVPGIPLTTGQFYLLCFLVFTAYGFYKGFLPGSNKFSERTLTLITIVIIYCIALLTWGLTTSTGHYFSLEPAAPGYQPYPNSDARIHDVGAISIIKGNGIYFHGFTDKPMYMVLLAILHLFSGNNYYLLIWLQIMLLSFTPVLLFLLGRKFHSPLFGIVLAFTVIFIQKNSISLSSTVASVNPKLLVTEEITLLGVILLSYLLFQWITTSNEKYSLLLGGVTGFFSLIRINPIFILPGIVLTGIFVLRKSPKILVRQLSFVILAFTLVFSPWLFSGVNVDGRSWFLLKIQDVIKLRYDFSSMNLPADLPVPVLSSVIPNIFSFPSNAPAPLILTAASVNTTANLVQMNAAAASYQTNNIVLMITNHIIHNFSASLLALPDSPVIDSLETLGKRIYWQDGNTWDGSFPPAQYIFILINLSLISLGIAFSWKKYRLAGLAPLILFIFYDLSLGMALNSGSRYIVPINWIIFFYYWLGLLKLLKTLYQFISIVPGTTTETITIEITNSPANKTRHLWRYFVMMALVGTILPAANWGIPALMQSSKDRINQQSFQNSIVQNDASEIFGYILYPYFDNNKRTIKFDFQTTKDVVSYTIARADLMDKNNFMIYHDQPALLKFSADSGILELKAVSFFQNGETVMIWQKNR